MKKIQILGNLTADAEIKRLESGTQILNFTVAVNTSYKNKQGERVKKTDYFDCFQFHGADRQIGMAPYLRKGQKFLIEGEPEASAYINKESVAVGKVKISVNEIYFAGSSGQADALANQPSAQELNNNSFTAASQEDDLPF